MKKYLPLLAFICTILFSSCAQDVVVSLQANPHNKGKIRLLPTRSTQETSIRFNDSLILDDYIVSSITILNVPDGTHTIEYKGVCFACPANIKQVHNVEVKNAESKAVPVPIPKINPVYFIAGTAIVISLGVVRLLM